MTFIAKAPRNPRPLGCVNCGKDLVPAAYNLHATVPVGVVVPPLASIRVPGMRVMDRLAQNYLNYSLYDCIYYPLCLCEFPKLRVPVARNCESFVAHFLDKKVKYTLVMGRENQQSMLGNAPKGGVASGQMVTVKGKIYILLPNPLDYEDLPPQDEERHLMEHKVHVWMGIFETVKRLLNREGLLE